MKKFISLLLVMAMLCSLSMNVFATTDYRNGTDVTYDPTDPDGIPDSGDEVDNEAYTITVPAHLVPGRSGTVTLTGAWASNRIVTVTSDPSVELTNSLNANDKKTLTVSFAGIAEAGSNTTSQTFTETVSVGEIINALFGTWSGHFNYNVEIETIKNSIPVTATDSEGKDLNASAYVVDGDQKDDLLSRLDETTLVESLDDVDLIVEVDSDDFDGLAETTFDVSDIAQTGDTVVILHFNEKTQEWEFVAEETVDDNGEVTADFSSYSPVAFVVVQKDGSTVNVLTPNNIIPEGGTYTDGSATYTAGQGFPQSVNDGDIYTYGNYVYTYQADAHGWKVEINTDVTDRNQTSYGSIVEDINGKPVNNMENLFDGCTSLTSAPKIPACIINMDNAFNGCSNLTGTVRIDANPITYYDCFCDVDFEAKKLSLNGNSVILDDIGVTGNNYCAVCNGYCRPPHKSTGVYLCDGTKFQAMIPEAATSIRFTREWHVYGEHKLFDVSAAEDGSIHAWLDGTTWVVSTSGRDLTIYANPDSRMMFAHDFTSINFGILDTSKVTNMSDMFYDCSNLKQLDLSTFNTNNVTDMSGMFQGCTGLTSLDLSSFNTSKVTSMGYMFKDCSSLTTLNLSRFDTRKVTSMSYMFTGCSSLRTLDLSSFNTCLGPGMTYMFNGCSELKRLDLSNFDTRNVYYMEQLFSDCNNLKTIIVGDLWSTAKVGSATVMFNNCASLVGQSGVTYDATKVNKSMANYETGYLTHKDNAGDSLDHNDGTTPTDGTTYEYGDYIYTYQTSLNGWKVAINTAVVDKNQTSYGPILESINGKPIVSLSNTFKDCTLLITAPVIPNTVTTLDCAFQNCTTLKTAPVIPSSVTGVYSAFKGCTALTGTITINANPSSCYQCFSGIDFELQEIMLTGTSLVLDDFGASGNYYCDVCNGGCIETEDYSDWDLNPDDGSTPANGDTFAYGDFIYTYKGTPQMRIPMVETTVINGWKVEINTAVTDKKQTSYSPILESINGEPVTDMSNTFLHCLRLKTAPEIPSGVISLEMAFYGCSALKNAPVIPSSVTNMNYTFSGCTALTGVITINSNPTEYADCFNFVDFKAQNITLTGSSTMLDALGAIGTNYCATCKGVCVE